MGLWEKVDSVVLRNFHDYWEDPLINKYLGEDATKKFEGILVIRKNKIPVWISHPFNYDQAKRQFGRKVKVVKYESIKDITKNLKKYAGKTVGYNPRHQTVLSFKNLKKFLKGRKLVNVLEELEEMREIKNPEEIKKITKAVRQTRKILKKAKSWLKNGVTEEEINKKMTEALFEDGFLKAFEFNIAFGKNTGDIHHPSTKTKLTTGPVLFDIGAKYKGYCADLSESIYFNENLISKKNKDYKNYCEKLELVKKCINAVESILKPGVSAQELWEKTKILGSLPYALGHGIGLEVHDFPEGVGSRSKFKLKEGMVMAIEAGVNNKKFGIRIENDYLITKNGFRKLG